MTTELEGGEGSASRPGRFLHPGKTRYPMYRKLGGPQSRSGQVREISPPSEFDPQTFHPVASRYINYATRPTLKYSYNYILLFFSFLYLRFLHLKIIFDLQHSFGTCTNRSLKFLEMNLTKFS